MNDIWKLDNDHKKIIEKLKLNSNAITITVNMFKGGVGKSTFTNMFGYISNKYNIKVLFVDSDPQRTLTKKLEKNFPITVEALSTFMQGIENGTLSNSISVLTQNIHLIQGDWNLAWFDRYSRRNLNIKDEFFVYDTLIKELYSEYDFIIFDSVPTTTTLTHNCIVASDYVIIPVESEEDCFTNSIDYMNYLNQMTQYNNSLDVLGILLYLTEDDNKTNQKYISKYQSEFGNIVFKNLITRSRRVMSWGSDGITENQPYDKKTLIKYINVYWEILTEINNRSDINE